MKIIIATPLWPPEIQPLATYAKNLAVSLQNEQQVFVLAYARQMEKIDGAQLIAVDKHRPRTIRIIKYFFQLLKLSKQADFIYCQNAAAAGLPAGAVKFFSKIPLIINFAEDEAWKRALHLRLTDKSLSDFLNQKNFDAKTRRLLKIQKWVLQRADKIIVPNQQLRQALAEHYQISQDKINLLPSPTPEPLILPLEIKIIPQQIFIDTPLYQWSKVDQLLAAVSRLKKDWPQLKLFIAGEGPAKDELKKLTNELKIAQQVNFVGRISQAEKQYLSQSSQIELSVEQSATSDSLAEQIKIGLQSGKISLSKYSWDQHLSELNKIFQP